MEYPPSDYSSRPSADVYGNHKLKAYVDRGMGNRYSKKMQFLKEDKHEFLQMICSQMHEKRDNFVAEQVDRIMYERNQLKEMKKKLVSD